MSDQQLLDLAAKAAMRAGLKLECPDELDGVYVSRCSGRNGYTWNPLEDDGDALRLAMVLELGVVCKRGSDPYEKNRSVVTDPYRVNQLRIVEMHQGNPEVATRRAIVRAAAEIGKAMQERH